MTTTTDIAAAVAAADYGRPSARKSGRNPAWPYVPIIIHGHRTEVVRKRAFATREQAVAYAAQQIDAARDLLARRLADPANRALREQHGLPRDTN